MDEEIEAAAVVLSKKLTMNRREIKKSWRRKSTETIVFYLSVKSFVLKNTEHISLSGEGSRT